MNNDQNKSEYWLSLEQYGADPEFAKRAETEFMSSPFKTEDGNDGVARRDFLKLMGASIALATTSCIRRPVQTIIPYAQAPKDYVPGFANFYTSTWYDGVEGYGVLVKTIEGRPIKMEGNPLYPMNRGSLTARGHAEVLSLYDPDRMKAPVRNLQNKGRTNRETISAKWGEVDPTIAAELAKGGVAILSSTMPSPSARAIIQDFTAAYPGTRWVRYDSLPADALLEGQRRSYGEATIPHYNISEGTKLVVTIDADILGTYLAPAMFMQQWAKARKPGPDMLRLVSFESTVSLTGLNADDRFAVKPSQQLDLVLALMGEVSRVSKGAASVPSGVSAAVRGSAEAGKAFGEALTKTAAQLWENRGRSVIIAGGLPTQTADAVDLQVAVNALNSMLGNDGAGVVAGSKGSLLVRQGSSLQLAQLIADMAAGKVKTLIIHDLNAVYLLPKDAGFLEALAKVGLVIYTGNRNDETGKYADYVLPNGTTLESWGDYELMAGVISIRQPTIEALHDSRAFEQSLLLWTKASKSAPSRAVAAKDWYEYVRTIWRTQIQGRTVSPSAGSFDEFWNAVLQTGMATTFDTTETARISGSARAFRGTIEAKARKPVEGFELSLYPSVQIADGRYANVAWMQELPDPVTKIVWDNYVMISLNSANAEGLKEHDVIELTVGNKSLKAPVHIQPGMPDGVLSIAVGYGRTDGGKVSKSVGVNAYDLAIFGTDVNALAGGPIFAGQKVTMKKTGEKYRLVSTQDHHSMEGRQIVVETTNAKWQKNESADIHRHKVFTIWPEHQYNGRKWAMSIDLNTCTGCSACVVACQSENNIPVVGKKYVMDGREMHWIRIDRYYKGTPENPEAVFQPMLCQHCETAPCETVCPVLATVHSDEGLNDMVYNRCVGTRYCSNNCPYKVRRFNWFNYAKREAPLTMALNPDVTVRTRGVMEKCTFCVHRIRGATNLAAAQGITVGKNQPYPDGFIKTACQQTCPANAITFGDLNDKNSAVAKLFQNQRTYAVLEEINTQPRVRYMSRVRNADRVDATHGHGKDHGSDHGAIKKTPVEAGLSGGNA